jgi:hypothetical protein
MASLVEDAGLRHLLIPGREDLARHCAGTGLCEGSAFAMASADRGNLKSKIVNLQSEISNLPLPNFSLPLPPFLF